MLHKRCVRCRRPKPISRSGGPRHPVCKDCRNTYVRRWHAGRAAANTAALDKFNAELDAVHNITPEEESLHELAMRALFLLAARHERGMSIDDLVNILVPERK